MSPLSSETSSDGSGGPRRGRLPRPSARAALLGVLVLAALTAVVLSTGSGGQSAKLIPAASHSKSSNPYPLHITTVVGSSVPAKQYGNELSRQQGSDTDDGAVPGAPPAAPISPVSPAAFAGPTAEYRAYAERWAATLAGEVPRLRAALAGGGRAAAERQWGIAFSDYLHLGAVYGLLPGTLDARIDGLPHALPGPGAPNLSFSGLHRIEMGLWTGAPPASLVSWANRLQTDVGTLQRVLPAVQIDPLDYATRAHEILEDAQRDFLSGVDVPWSGAGVLATAAGVTATEEVVSTLTPLLEQRDGTLLDVNNWLDRLQTVLGQLRAAHGGNWPSLGQLTLTQREELNGTMAGALGPLSNIPGSLETTGIPVIPRIPASK
ncbi:MAG TPA: EfeM/EfeO family lipoprotein [Solirubrobacteraceae bacterium]|nr:EfeM/EfeO family lipoprotein [Solirubrobacteraceae bacterium]